MGGDPTHILFTAPGNLIADMPARKTETGSAHVFNVESQITPPHLISD
jgi:hypothetical protein